MKSFCTRTSQRAPVQSGQSDQCGDQLKRTCDVPVFTKVYSDYFERTSMIIRVDLKTPRYVPLGYTRIDSGYFVIEKYNITVSKSGFFHSDLSSTIGEIG